MKYLFPFAQVPAGSRVAIYGASDIGYDYYRQLMSSSYASVSGWVDCNYEMHRILRLPVDSPDDIVKMSYDYVVVAVLDEKLYETIRRWLIEKGVDASKIIWNESPIVEYDIAAKNEAEAMTANLPEPYEVKPIDIIDEDRLDIIVRYIYANEILSGTIKGQGKRLYEEMFLGMNNAIEPTDHFLFRFFTGYSEKRGLKAFEEEFEGLIYSMRDKGFIREEYIPIGSNGRMINGSHRVAAALALNNKVWVREYPIQGVKVIDHHFGEKWFLEHNFSEEDIKLLKDCYNRLKEGENNYEITG